MRDTIKAMLFGGILVAPGIAHADEQFTFTSGDKGWAMQAKVAAGSNASQYEGGGSNYAAVYFDCGGPIAECAAGVEVFYNLVSVGAWSYFCLDASATGRVYFELQTPTAFELGWEYHDADPPIANISKLTPTGPALVEDISEAAGNNRSGKGVVLQPGRYKLAMRAGARVPSAEWSSSDAWLFLIGEAEPACDCDLTFDGALNLDDIDTFATAFIANETLADLTADGAWNLDDIDQFASCFVAGCP